MNLIQLVLKDNEHYEKKILYIENMNGCNTAYVIKFSSFNNETNRKVYGLKYFNLNHNFGELPNIYTGGITSSEYNDICKFENIDEIYVPPFKYYPIKFIRNDGYIEIKLLKQNYCDFTSIDVIAKDKKFKSIENLGAPEFYFVSKTDDNECSLFKIDFAIDKDNNYVPKIEYIVKDCMDFGYIHNARDLLLFQENKDSIDIFSYIDGIEKTKYKGKVISKNQNYIILKNNNEYLFFSKFNSAPIAIYNNDNITNMQFCSIDDNDRLSYDYDVLILTTKDNKQKLLPIIINSDDLFFIETEKEFDNLTFKCCSITGCENETATIFYKFSGMIGNKSYEIAVSPNGNIETLGTCVQNSKARVLKRNKQKVNFGEELPF